MNHIITYFYLENNGENNEYGVKYSDINKKNEIYFRCIINFFKSSIANNPTSKHYFICNETENIEFIKSFNFKDFLNKENIELVNVKSKYVKPKKKWAGSMYLFDAIEHFENKNVYEDNYIFFDNDIIINENLDSDTILNSEFNYIAYNITHEYKKNGEWILDFNNIDTKYIENNKFIPLGGEFLALKGKFIKKFISDFKNIKDKKGLHTEEHFLSYMNANCLKDEKKILLDKENTLVRRIWTTIKYNTFREDDIYVKIIHIPSEKEFGLKWLSEDIIKNNKYDRNLALSYSGIPKRNFYINIKLLFNKVKLKLKNI